MNEQNLNSNEPIQSSKTIWITIIAVVITAIIVGGGVYAWQKSSLRATEQSLQQQITLLQNQISQLQQVQQGQNVNQPTANSNQNIGPEDINVNENLNINQPADPYADWQTYQNTKYGFELKYPYGYTAYLVNAVSGAKDSNGTKVVFLANGEQIGSLPYLVIEYNDNKRSSYLSDPSIELVESNRIIIDGISGTKDKFNTVGNKSMSWTTVYLNKGGITYSITPNKNLANFDQLLETFKFTR